MSIDFPLLNISNCQLVLKYLSLYGNLFILKKLYLHDSYITKFDFMNYAFGSNNMKHKKEGSTKEAQCFIIEQN